MPKLRYHSRCSLMKKIIDFIKYYAIRISIIVVFFLIIIAVGLSYWSRQVLDDRNEFIKDHAAMTSYIEGLANNVTLMDLGLRGYYMSEQEGFLSPYNTALASYTNNLNNLKSMAIKYGYPAIDSIDYIIDEIVLYEELVTKGVEDISSGNREAAADVFNKDPGLYLYQKYVVVTTSLNQYFSRMEQESKSAYENSTTLSFISLIALLFVGGPVLIFALRRMRRNDYALRNLFSSLEESNKKYVFNSGEAASDAKTDQVNIINNLIVNLRKASGFIQSITKADLNVKWEGMTEDNKPLNKETISGELITMREQMRKVKEEESRRFWLTEGISKFGEMVRLNQDNLEKMSQILIAEVVKYTESNQGGLFLLKTGNDEEYLELSACYAFERRKFIEKRIEIGQGLVGRAYLEGDTIRLSDIPTDYLNITSGLGKALPKNIIIIPLKTNDKIEGVMELASFETFKDYQIEFLEKLGEILASAIINANNTIRTKELLEMAQQNEEEMRSQEEEMRQNMEELQATQEEMHRKEQEYLERIESLESELSTKEV